MYLALSLKSCPRCGGDLGMQQDCWGRFWTCLNCSRQLYSPGFHPITQRPGLALPVGRWI